jgi:hypothetical protein
MKKFCDAEAHRAPSVVVRGTGEPRTDFKTGLTRTIDWYRSCRAAQERAAE